MWNVILGGMKWVRLSSSSEIQVSEVHNLAYFIQETCWLCRKILDCRSESWTLSRNCVYFPDQILKPSSLPKINFWECEKYQAPPCSSEHRLNCGFAHPTIIIIIILSLKVNQPYGCYYLVSGLYSLAYVGRGYERH